jgi:hypothetical protein
MKPLGFEPAIPTGERQHTHVFERATTGIGKLYSIISTIFFF